MIRSPQVRLFDDELVIDCFAGGGGASTGIEMAIGRSPDIAINHDREALALHEANHPLTRHIRSNIRRVSFRRECAGRKVGLAWFSPDCTYHSKARGGKPYRPRNRARRIRGLIWEAARCAAEVRPRVICIENVEELRDWCPLTKAGRPDPTKRGQSFERFNARMRNLGYMGEWREERASIKGAPTIRKRLFGVFKCDGQPIVWKPASHGPNAPLPFRTAAECIDFNEPVPSIFLTPAQAKAWGKAHGRPSPKRPLVKATLRRLARGIDRFVVKHPKPFLIRYNTEHGDDVRGQATDAPITTLDTSNRFGLVTPVIAPVVVNTRNGEREGQAPRTQEVTKPYNTVTAQGSQGAIGVPVLAPFITKYREDSAGATVDGPAPTITANTFHKRPGGNPPLALASPVLAPFLTEHANASQQRTFAADEPLRTQCANVKGGHFAIATPVLIGVGGRKGQSPETSVVQPYHTITAKADTALVAAFLAKHNGGHEATGQMLTKPADTLVARDNKALVSSLMVKLRGAIEDHINSSSQDVREPGPTLTAGGTHVAEVRTVLVPTEFAEQYPRAHLVAAFLLKYYGSKKDGTVVDGPIGTVTTRERFALVVVTIDGQDFAIVDIGMRMLMPRELYNCQGFPSDYKINVQVRVRKKDAKSKRGYVYQMKWLTKSAQVRMCGNSVSPVHCESIVSANYSPELVRGIA